MNFILKKRCYKSLRLFLFVFHNSPSPSQSDSSNSNASKIGLLKRSICDSFHGITPNVHGIIENVCFKTQGMFQPYAVLSRKIMKKNAAIRQYCASVCDWI